MIEFDRISRFYGSHEALHEVSFSVGGGQIVGLLGQNGAGKTTALNILTGYLPPTTGSVRIGGIDMLADARAAKRLIGYLPERPPLYDEMDVAGYIAFAGRLRGIVKADLPGAVEDALTLCGLQEVRSRLIGHLSKGYRQRVGIAQAICGNPPLIVLDEPTVGLDPKQVVDIRELIRRLGENHTVIFSSHILSEVQQLCTRALILHKGRLIRQVDLHALPEGSSSIHLHAVIAAGEKQVVPALQEDPHFTDVQVLSAAPDQTAVSLTTHTAGDASPEEALFRILVRLNAPLLELVRERDTLEETFLRITAEE